MSLSKSTMRRHLHESKYRGLTTGHTYFCETLELKPKEYIHILMASFQKFIVVKYDGKITKIVSPSLWTLLYNVDLHRSFTRYFFLVCDEFSLAFA